MTEAAPYIARNPGDLITAEDWNDLQTRIQQDIADQVRKAIDAITKVPSAADAEKLSGQSKQEIEAEVLKKVFEQLPQRTGYTMMFKRLKVGQPVVIGHGLKAFPLVDVYELQYFPVLCSEDDERDVALVNYFLYHDNEKKLRGKVGAPTTTAVSVSIEDEPRPYRIAFKDMLDHYEVDYKETSTLSEIESAFWDAFDRPPNDVTDDDQSCHSPWFDRCCGEERTKKDIGTDWNRLFFSMRPRKLLNPTGDAPAATTKTDARDPLDPPPQVQVVHYDLDTIGLELLNNPKYGPVSGDGFKDLKVPHDDELAIMLLLKV